MWHLRVQPLKPVTCDTDAIDHGDYIDGWSIFSNEFRKVELGHSNFFVLFPVLQATEHLPCLQEINPSPRKDKLKYPWKRHENKIARLSTVHYIDAHNY